MLISSGQILTGKFKDATASVIETKPDAKGFYESYYKALVVDSTTAATAASDVNGTWVKVADASSTAKDFVGVAGNDPSPQANVDILNGNKPYCNGWGEDYNVPAGGTITIERNAVLKVIASEAIAEGDLITVGGANGAFKKATTLADAVGRAYTSAAKDECFVAYIGAY